MLKMNSKVYKWCAVPLCKNTSIATPNKLFVYVPNKKIVRDKWLKLARRNPSDVAINSPLYFCEDHFDLPNDMENYMKYHLMGTVSKVRMNPGCVPKKFACQPDRKTRIFDTIERPCLCKCKKQLEEKTMVVTKKFDFEEIASGSSGEDVQRDQEGVQNMDILCKNCQNIIVGFRYKCITCEDYDLCKKCEMMETHSEHCVLRIPKALKSKEAVEIAQKLQKMFKPNEGISPLKVKEEHPIGVSIRECGDDEPIQDDNVDEDIHSSEQFKNITRSEVSRIIDKSKDVGEPTVTVRRKRKRTAEREAVGDGKRMLAADEKVNAAQQIAFTDANSDSDESYIEIEIKEEICEESEIISRLDVGETVNPYVKKNQL